MQNFKSVYFADHPGGNAKRRNLKLAFGPGDADLFRAIGPLSSEISDAFWKATPSAISRPARRLKGRA